MSIQSNLLKYKGYTGSVEYSLEDRCLYGKILFIDDLITYEGNTIDELEEAFKYMVDDYLKTCEEIGKNPQKSYSGTFNVRVQPEVHQALASIAKTKGITLNELVKDAFNSYVNYSEIC